jgi:hypothetical protein
MVILGVALASPLLAGPVIPWNAAPEHLGRRITIEGRVVHARREGSATVLEFVRGDPQAFTVKLIEPLFRRGPRDPEAHYQGKRVQATGVVQEFQGRAEMIVRDADKIVALEDAAEESGPRETDAREPDERCAAARTEWRDLRPTMKQALDAMQACLSEEREECKREIGALHAALADVEAAQAKLGTACQDR